MSQMLEVGGGPEGVILGLTGGDNPGKVTPFREYAFVPRKHIPENMRELKLQDRQRT